ncbi:MAG TPA: SCO family protein [Azospirillum sp.]|nr:SCO family protein [Azospirillum sp.]
MTRPFMILPLLALLAGPAMAHDAHQHHGPKDAPAGTASLVTIRLPDVRFVDATGTARRLDEEVIGPRLVVMDFIFTSCTSVCPVLSSILGVVQDRLGPRLGPEVAMVSVSVDPANDTPARLKDYGARFGAGPEWTFLTGAKPDVDRLLARAGVNAPSPADHTPVVLVGDPDRQAWVRLYGMPTPEQILNALDTVAQGRERAAAGVAFKEAHHGNH